jgi:DNA-binding response OmpR family regulator
MSQCRKKVLCIEDDHDTAELIAEELVEHGYDVRVAADGGQGLAAILKFKPDLVLTDIILPVLSGFDILERLAAAGPKFCRPPVVFVTAMADHDVELKARQLGIFDFVIKPIDFEALHYIVRAHLAAGSPNICCRASEKKPRAITLYIHRSGKRRPDRRAALWFRAGP